MDEFSEKTGAVIDLKINGEIARNYEADTAMYHVLQESLTNAVRHGKCYENLRGTRLFRYCN